jgi:alpha-L-rhamnosidase
LWNFRAEKACSHFLKLFADGQRSSGQLSGIAPTGGWGFNWGSGPAWDSLLFEYPWRMYLFCGNVENISYFYGNMQRYIDYCGSRAEEHLLDFELGDWCHHDQTRIAPVKLTSTAYYYYDVTRMVEFANILGRKEDAAHYTELAGKIRSAFNRNFYRGEGCYASGEWTSLAAALYFELAEESNRSKIAENLVKKVRANNHRTDFGILGAKYVPRVLADYGYADDAFKLITQTDFPGWGYWVANGATTLWENWSGADSQNHIMYGDISAWMYQYPAGLSPLKEAPGFKKFVIKPEFINALSFVRMRYESPCGLIRSEWKREKDKIICEFEIPQGSSADITLPGRTIKNATGIQQFTL